MAAFLVERIHKHSRHVGLLCPVFGRGQICTRSSLLGLALLVLAAASSSFAEKKVALGPEQIDAIDRVVQEQLASQRIVGSAIGVLIDGKIALTKGYGFADLEKQLPVTTDTVFNWASNSKPVAAILAMQLVEQGLLDLGADVRKYVPEFPEKDHVVQVRHLLSHQSGLPHYANGRVIPESLDSAVSEPAMDPLAAIKIFSKSPLLFTPGEKYSYSSYGYVLLSAVVERAGKTAISEQLKQRIISPLELTSFQLDTVYDNQANWVMAYAADKDGKQVRVVDQAHSWKHGAGGYKSNVIDFAKWAGALLNSRLVAKSIETQMWEVQPTRDGSKNTYGLGFNVFHVDNLRRVFHGGSQEETKTFMLLVPDTRTGVVVMCNAARGRPEPIATAILDVVDGSQ